MSSIRPYRGMGFSVESWGGTGHAPYSVDIYPSVDGGVVIVRSAPWVRFDTLRHAVAWAREEINLLDQRRATPGHNLPAGLSDSMIMYHLDLASSLARSGKHEGGFTTLTEETDRKIRHHLNEARWQLALAINQGVYDPALFAERGYDLKEWVADIRAGRSPRS